MLAHGPTWPLRQRLPIPAKVESERAILNLASSVMTVASFSELKPLNSIGERQQVPSICCTKQYSIGPSNKASVYIGSACRNDSPVFVDFDIFSV